MTMRDVLSFRRPKLDAQQSAVLDERAVIAQRIEECRSRLESVELLLSSGARDAMALCRHLFDDIVVAFAALGSVTEDTGVEQIVAKVADKAIFHDSGGHIFGVQDDVFHKENREQNPDQTGQCIQGSILLDKVGGPCPYFIIK